MAPHVTASRPAVLLLALVLAGGTATEASAQSGNGLYEPFPEAAVKKRAERYVGRLAERTPAAGRRPSAAELEAGVFVGSGHSGLAPASTASRAPRSASARAGESETTPLALPLQLLLLVAAFAIPVTAAASRARLRPS